MHNPKLQLQIGHFVKKLPVFCNNTVYMIRPIDISYVFFIYYDCV